MFGYGSHSSTADISKRLEALRNDITLLGEALAGAAEENTRTPRHEAGRYIGSAVKSLEREAASLAADGLSVDHAHDLVARKPGSILLGAVVVGLTVGYVLYAMTGTPSRRR
ncbi:MAG: hypothetical protein B7Y61_23620 [Rhizobiales bacterium 35-66-30]|nr:MAG: hypothetical protein B7Y61_23620 [Rhizobiales bacterium 35-66-30]